MNDYPANRWTRHTKPLFALVMLTCLSASHGRSADRNQAVDISAGRGLAEADVRLLSEGVTITQGSLNVQSDTASVHTDDAGQPVRLVFTGSPVNWTEVLDSGQTLAATAGQIDYNLSSGEVVLENDVLITKGSESIEGEHVRYDLNSSRLDAGSTGDGRIRMRFTPKPASAEDDDIQ